MSIIYRLHSVAFGEYLEKMIIGLIEKFIEILNDFAYQGRWKPYYRAGWVWVGELNHKRVYTIEVCDETQMEQLIEGINDAYNYLFLTRDNNINIRISFEDYSWDKYHETYLKVLKIDDSDFFPYQRDAYQFWLK